MPRTARIIVPNCPHHIVQRGHNRNVVFVSDNDYEHYLSTLAEWRQELKIKVYAYCLMTNHVHLIVEPGDTTGSVSLLMKRLAGRQTRYVNKLERRSGSLWEGRYKISPIATADYLLRCCRYVDLNPVKANMVELAEQYRWSSYRAKIGIDHCEWLDFDDYYLGMTDPVSAYRGFVESGINEEEHRFIQQVVASNQLTGNTAFIDEIELRLGIRIENRKPGRPVK